MLSRRDFLKAAIGLASGIAGGIGYARYGEPARVTVTRLKIPVPGLPREFQGFRVVQLSDLHLGPWTDERRLDDWITRALALRPDVLVMTGDWVTGLEGVAVLERAVPVLSRYRAPEGVFTVLGNHDYWADARRVRRALEAAGIRELRNDVYIFRRGKARLALAGIDDAWSGRPLWEETAAMVPEGVPALVLLHEPDFAERTQATGRFLLQLSGHSHGGQVWIPGRGPMVLPLYGRRYPAGLYRVGEMWLYTSRGLGMSVVPFRLFCPPEIVLIELVGEERKRFTASPEEHQAA